MAWLKNYWHLNLSYFLEEYKGEVYMTFLTKTLRRTSFDSAPLKSTKASKVCTNGKKSQKDKRLVMWF